MKKILVFSFILILSHLIFAQSQRPINTRTIQATSYIDYYAFIQHSNEDSSETFYKALNFDFGSSFKKFKADGTLKWSATASRASATDLSLSKHNTALDLMDNLVFNYNPSGLPTERWYKDPSGFKTTLSNEFQSIVKINKNGTLVFAKALDFVSYPDYNTSVYFDSVGDIYVLGANSKVVSSLQIDIFYILKLDGQTGEQIFLKNYEGIFPNSATLTFDNNDNFYIFLDSDSDVGNYTFDTVSVPIYYSNNILLKYDKNGGVISGKNFQTSNNSGFTIIADAKFDGENIVLSGYLLGVSVGDHVGLDGVVLPRKYNNVGNQGLLAKADLNGVVIWQKPIYSNTNLDNGMWSNIGIDGGKNIYGYYFFRNKITFNNIEYQFGLQDGNKVITKFDTNGNAFYFNEVDTKIGYPDTYNSMMVDVIDVDKFNLAGITRNDNFLKYSLVTPYIGRSYIATFGNLSKKYLTPENNYLELTAANIPNNPAPTPNEFSFSLVNNVNWTATSDQPWLNLSSISLTSKSPQQTITGNGDAKITLTADQNTTGLTRSSNVIISGEGVPFKTVIVSQTATLGTNNNALSIITMYPNPTSDFLNIKSDQKISKIEIYDMSGKLVQTSKMNNEKVSVSKLPKGNYVIKIQTENGVVNSKFIKN